MINPTTTGGWSNNTESLKELMHSETVDWLQEKTKNFLLDYQNIKMMHSTFGVGGLSDYSYLITPAFKALEGVLIQIAEKLGFDVEKNAYKIGAVFDEEKLSKFYESVLNKVEEMSEDDKEDIKMWLNDARKLLRHFRHSPAHFNGEVKENWNKAFQFGDHLFSTIDELCYSLIKSGLVS